jgi:hypothetical protein
MGQNWVITTDIIITVGKLRHLPIKNDVVVSLSIF